MREQIYTIPVSEAFETKNGKCPLCLLREKWENNELDLILGASMMDPDVRMQTNEAGFCDEHLKKMLNRGNRLSMALTLESHLETVAKNINTKGIFSSDKSPKTVKYIDELNRKCYICSRIDETIERMTETVILLYDREKDFRELFSQQTMFCLPHFKMLLEEGKRSLPKKRYEDFLTDISDIENKYIDELKGDISWFCKKFDYRYEKEDWKNSKDSVERTIEFLNGIK